MSNATTVLTGATKYRIATRERLQNGGWAFTQVKAGTDEYRQDGVIVQLVHGPKNTMTRAEISDGKATIEVIGDGQLKLERALAKMLGTPATRWVMTDAEVKALPPVGSGSARILTQAEIDAVADAAQPTQPEETVKEDANAVSPEAKPTPKPAPRRKAPARKAG